MNLIFFICIFIASGSLYALEVVFINPATTNNPFWQQVSRIATAAASDLNIKLTIIHGNSHRLFQHDAIETLISAQEKPDYVIFLPVDGTAFNSFTMLEQAKIPFLTLERSVFPDLQYQLGAPGQHFKYWLGEIYHDNKKAGNLLAKALINASNKNNKTTIPSGLNVVGISGDLSGHSSERNAGLIAVLEADTQYSLAQIVSARWQRQVSAQMMFALLRRYPDLTVVWTAAELMALGVADVANSLGKTINTNLFIGGFDWTTEALIAIKANKYTASVGGHFMQAAWALVKIYDHHQGVSKLPVTYSMPTYQLQLIDCNNINDYQVLMDEPNWDSIDFKKFSLQYDLESSTHQFSFSKILKALTQQYFTLAHN